MDKIPIRDLPLLSTNMTVVDAARNLGVITDSQLSLDAHVAALCRSGYYQLRQLHPATRSLSTDTDKTLVQALAFVSSRLDYCNSLLCVVSEELMRRLQSVQNTAARLVTGTCRRDHTMPILRHLHWLPMRQVQYKIAVSVFQCLTGQAPTYLADDCQLVFARPTQRCAPSDARTTFSATGVLRPLAHTCGTSC